MIKEMVEFNGESCSFCSKENSCPYEKKMTGTRIAAKGLDICSGSYFSLKLNCDYYEKDDTEYSKYNATDFSFNDQRFIYKHHKDLMNPKYAKNVLYTAKEATFALTDPKLISTEMVKEMLNLEYGKKNIDETHLIPEALHLNPEYVKNCSIKLNDIIAENLKLVDIPDSASKPRNIAKKMTVALAMDTLIAALKEDNSPGSYYYSWQSTLACAIMDNSDIEHDKANEIACKFLDNLIK